MVHTFYGGKMESSGPKAVTKRASQNGPWQRWDEDGKVEGVRIAHNDSGAAAKAARALPSLSHAPIKKRWWKKKNPCPAGGSLAGEPKPKGTEVYCELDGAPHGPSTSWHMDLDIRDHLETGGGYVPNDQVGKIAEVGRYRDGAKHGEWQSFDERGKLVRRSSWRDGSAYGAWIWYKGRKTLGTVSRDDTNRPEFDVVAAKWWNNAELHCPKGTHVVSETGAGLHTHCQWPDRTRHGPSAWFDTDGQLAESTYYRDGVEHGPDLRWSQWQAH